MMIRISLYIKPTSLSQYPPRPIFTVDLLPLIIWLVLLGAIITGFGRRFEGANGEQVLTQESS